MSLSRRALLTGRIFEAVPVRARLSTARCLPWQGVVCTSCADVCPEDAIAFDPRGRPSLRAERCTGCGDCVPPCPAGAWSVPGA